MDNGRAPTRTDSPSNRVLVLAAPTSAEDREQARAFCAFLGLHGVEAWLELVAARGAGDLQGLLDDDTVHWVLVVASPGFAQLSAQVHTDRPTIVPVVLPGGRAEELPCWADPESGRIVPVTEFSAEGAEPLLRIVLPATAAARRVPPPTGAGRIRPSEA